MAELVDAIFNMTAYQPRSYSRKAVISNIFVRMRTFLHFLLILSLIRTSASAQQTILIDDFQDGDLVANNWANWRVRVSPENADGYVQVFQNDTSEGTRTVHARFTNGTGSYINSIIQLCFGDLSGMDMHRYSQLRFRAKGDSYPIEVRMESQPITDYSDFRYTTATLTSSWQQFTIDLDSLHPPAWTGTSLSETGAVILDSALRHAWSFDFAILADTGTVSDLWIDDVEWITNPNYIAPSVPILPSNLKQAALAANVDLGFAMGPNYIADSLYRSLIELNATSISPEWGLVMSEIRKYPDRFDFSLADATVKWAYDHGMKAKGENLVWYAADPDWLTKGNYTSAQADSILKEYLQTTLTYYKTKFPGTITHWSLVNEAIDPSTYTYRNTFWYQKLGASFIEKAFTYAHQADPDVKLYYNDFNAEGLNRKSDTIYAMVKRLKDKGVPIDGVGLQMHTGLKTFPGKASVLANINRLGALGLEVYITEIDVAINQDGANISTPRFPQQGQIYRQVLEACIESGHCRDYQVWGITDRYSWYEQYWHKLDWPLVTDFNYQPKDAWNQILSVMQSTYIPEVNINHVNLYPNPTQNLFTIVADVPVTTCSIYDLTGKSVIRAAKMDSAQTVDVSSLKSGVYFVAVSTNNSISYSKLVKE